GRVAAGGRLGLALCLRRFLAGVRAAAAVLERGPANLLEQVLDVLLEGLHALLRARLAGFVRAGRGVDRVAARVVVGGQVLLRAGGHALPQVALQVAAQLRVVGAAARQVEAGLRVVEQALVAGAQALVGRSALRHAERRIIQRAGQLAVGF